MKLVSWNVNGIRAVLTKGFQEFFKEVDADIFCIQETKCQEGQVDLSFEGYESYWNSAEKKGYSGTAIFTKIKPISVNFNTTENHIGDLSGRFNIKTTEKYIVPEIVKKESKCEITKNQKRRAKEQEEIFCNFTKGEKRAVIYRDSFTINLIPFLSETFAKSTYYRTYQVSINEIKDADIVVIERVERGINIFQDLVPIKE